MTTVAIEQAQRELAGLIEKVARGERVVITRGRVPVAELSPVAPAGPRPTFGSARGMVTMAADFDAPLKDFQDYTQ